MLSFLAYQTLRIPTRTRILIYQDKGVNEQSTNAIAIQLKSLLSENLKIKKVDSNYLNSKNWERKTLLLVMGGGKCSEWDKNFQSTALQKIEKYVKDGGNYIGLCAGAYFASAITSYKLKNSPLIEKKRSLAFFPGKAIGPIIETDEPLSPKSAIAAEIYWKGNGYLYYQGGCYFSGTYKEVKTIAKYAFSNQPAAIHCKVGKGNAFLCGLHPEFPWGNAELKTIKNPHFEKLEKTLSSQEPFRIAVWQEICKILKLKTIFPKFP